MNKAQMNKNTNVKAGELLYVQAIIIVKGAQKHLVEEHASKRE